MAHPHLAKGGAAAASCRAVLSLVWVLALLFYTYAVAVSVRQSVPPCQCALTSAAHAKEQPRLEYREENACDPVRWALWGGEKAFVPEKDLISRGKSLEEGREKEEGKKGGGGGDAVLPAEDKGALSGPGNSTDVQAHENPHATKEASRFKFYGQRRGDSPYEPDRIAYTKFFAGAGGSIHKVSNTTEKRRKDLWNGVFVEVGAGDGQTNSMSLFFERNLNWTGVLIEGATPNAARLNETKRKPSTAKVLNPVCEGKRSVKMIGNGNSAGIEASMTPEEMALGLKEWDAKWKKAYEVPCMKLADVLKDTGIKAVDLMTVDIKVSDAALVLRGFDFDTVSVRVMLVNLPEATKTSANAGAPESDVRDKLLAHGYCLAARVGPLEYWTKDPEFRKQHCGWASFYTHP
jgi:hypothetical protein